MEAKLDWDAVFDEERVVVAFDGVGLVGHHGRKGNVEVEISNPESWLGLR